MNKINHKWHQQLVEIEKVCSVHLMALELETTEKRVNDFLQEIEEPSHALKAAIEFLWREYC